MDAVDGQEVSFPVAMPASLWQESGRYESVGKEMVRFVDRNKSPMVLGMTHEEPAVQMVREYGQTYAKYPFMIYQIQTKFRDEARPRAGLIRVREFTMKDAYSFHTSVEDFEAYYQRCHDAYERICARAGIPEIISVLSDSGMMGGNAAHEFMLLTPVGEDTIVTCSRCDYRANMEAAESIVINEKTPETALTLVHTPGCATIDDVCAFLGVPVNQSCKTVVYQKESDDGYVVVFLRGDLEVNEVKVKNIVGEDIYPGVITAESGLAAGYIGPYGLTGVTVLMDRSLKHTGSLCCGANKPGYHYTGFSVERDTRGAVFHDIAKAVENGICPTCNETALVISRGIEIGNIFQLGTKYTQSMNMQYTDHNGDLHYPVMGCYGIGVGRLAAAACEVHHDDYGPIWPFSIAPWHVHICCVRADDKDVKAYADGLYQELLDKGVETIYDDRTVSAGVMFSDADLIGVPVRVIVSPRNMKEGYCEIATRDKKIVKKVKTGETITEILDLLQSLKM
jgi:prolyl-tRNA synthetase